MRESDLIHTLIEGGGGVLLTREAAAAGISPQVLSAVACRGEVHRLTRGAVVATPPTGDAEHRRLLSVGGLRLYPDAQLASSAAVAGWGVPVARVPVVRLDLARPLSHEVLTREYRIRPTRVPAQTSPLGPADPLPTALVQMALDVGLLESVASIDAALHAGLVTTAELEQSVELVRGWPASAKASCALDWSDARSESLGESITRMILRAGGILTTPQVTIHDVDGTFVARCDLGVDGTRVLVEFDGKVKYADGGADALFAEKQREDRLRRLGFVVVRVVWADLYRSAVLVARVRDAILTAAA